MKKPNKKVKYKISIEIILVLFIAGLMIFLNEFTTNKINEIIISDREALLIHHDPGSPVREELAKKIIEFRPEACKMIEVYSEDFDPILYVQFTTDSNPSPNTIKDHPELLDLLRSNSEGHAELTIENKTEDVYFQWTETEEGEKCLIITYMSRPIVNNIWIFSFTCYIILILVFVLLIRLHLVQYRSSIRHYKATSDVINDKINNNFK